MALNTQQFTTTDGSVVFLGDPLAKTGPLGFIGSNDPSDANSAMYLTDSEAVTVSARSPIPLTPGMPVDTTFEKELETGFFSADLVPGAANEGLLVEAWANVPADSTMKPVLLAYPASGKGTDLLDQGVNADARIAYPVTTSSKAFFVVLDEGLGHGPTTKMTLIYRAARGQVVTEKPKTRESAEAAQNIGSLPGATAAVPARIVSGELTAAEEVDVYELSGLSAINATDLLVSVISDANVVVQVDTVPTFDSDNLVVVRQREKAGLGTTTNFVGKDRYIRVAAKPDSGKQTGRYTLGIRRLAPVDTQH